MLPDPSLEMLAANELHHHVSGSMVFEKTKHPGDVGMVELGEGPGLLNEALFCPAKSLLVRLSHRHDSQVINAYRIVSGQEFLDRDIRCESRVMS